MFSHPHTYLSMAFSPTICLHQPLSSIQESIHCYPLSKWITFCDTLNELHFRRIDGGSHLSAWFLAVVSPDQEIKKEFPGICTFCISMQAGFGVSPRQSSDQIQVQPTSLHIQIPRWICPQSLCVKMLQDTKNMMSMSCSFTLKHRFFICLFFLIKCCSVRVRLLSSLIFIF